MKAYLIPTQRVWYVLGGVLLAVLALSFLNFPFGSFMSMNPDLSAKFEIGWPIPFFTIDLLNPETLPIKWGTLILSLLGYCIVSYIIDVAISVIILGLTKPVTLDEIYTQARKAYFYQKSQGIEESKIKEMFKQKGWKNEDIAKLKE